MKKWTVTLPNGKTQIFEEEPNGTIHVDGTSGTYTADVFAAGLAKMRAMGATVIETTIVCPTIDYTAANWAKKNGLMS